METILSLQSGDVLGAVRGLLRGLLESGWVEALYVPMETDEGVIVPALVTDPALLERANPLAPVMPINGARAVSALTAPRLASTNGHAPRRLGAVLRACEVRALVELAKLQQACLDGLTLVSLDCAGTLELPDYAARQAAGGDGLKDYLASAARGGADLEPQLRPACQMCTEPASELAHVRLHLFGADLSQGIPVTLPDELAARLSLAEAAVPGAEARQAVAGQVRERRQQVREREQAAIRQRLQSPGGLASLFAACIRCHNCMTACPVCYCKTCLFRTAAFDHPPEHYLNAARHKGAARMLGDTLLFHLTRLNHMSASCVACGMCTSACPADIPVGLIFSAVGAGVQAEFEYVPGREVRQPLPMITFQPDELIQVGEAA